MLKAAVEVDSVGVEKEAELYEQKVHVDGHKKRDDQKWRGSKELVNWFISNHRKRRGIVEHMMMLMMLPESFKLR